MYNPLPKQVELRKSSIHGYGLFAKENIPKNTILGISHVCHGLFPDGWIRTPLGGFYNHSETPNCKLVKNHITKAWNPLDEELLTEIKQLKTIQNIKKDTELTCTYTIWKATPEMQSTTKNWLGL